MIEWEDFEKVDMRVGRIVADEHPVLLLEPDSGSQPGDRIA